MEKIAAALLPSQHDHATKMDLAVVELGFVIDGLRGW